MSTLEDQLKQITSALEDLRATTAAGPDSRKALDALFRRAHNLKAAAAAEGLNDLSRAAHELENVLHSLRTGTTTLNDELLQQLTERSAALSEILPIVPPEIWKTLKAEERHSLSQAVKEGANLFLVETSFDVADFDQRFQKLKEILGNTGELISIAPQAVNNRINFRIVYARRAAASEIRAELGGITDVTVEELTRREAISFAEVLQRAVRAGKSAAAALGKTIEFNLSGEDLSLDNSLCNVVADPLMHLIRNAVDHGIEHTGTITIEAALNAGAFQIKVTDDGRGINPETIATGKLFHPGFSTASELSEISGRGVGLDVVKTTIEAAGGSIKVTSEPGAGSSFELTLPIRVNNQR